MDPPVEPFVPEPADAPDFDPESLLDEGLLLSLLLEPAASPLLEELELLVSFDDEFDEFDELAAAAADEALRESVR